MIFLFYNFDLSSQLNLSDWLRIFLYGLKLDVSSTGYIMILPVLFIILSPVLKTTVFNILLNIYSGIVLFILTFILLVDLELYKHWGFHVDSTPLMYLNTPVEMLASVTAGAYILLISLLIIVFLSVFFSYRKFISRRIRNILHHTYYDSLVFTVILCLLIIPIRFSFGLAPVNLSSVYFHSNNFANHAAVNVVWNFTYSLTQRKEFSYNYHFMEKQKAQKYMDDLHRDQGITSGVLSTSRPNILFIIVESFTSKVTGKKRNNIEIIPRFNELQKEGILFSGMYASGFRTDKGIVAILSGYPSQPASSIILYPEKTSKLPYIPRDMKNSGYRTAFYYGGEINFANMYSYCLQAGFEKIITKNDFPSDSCNSKWGAHDHVVFNRLLKDLRGTQQPFCYAILTLSSHEPFDVPMKTVFAGSDDDTRFINSLHYTDMCIGQFIDEAKKTKWWKNTLIIIVADHGAIRPGNSENHEPLKYTIPMLWLGGALNRTDTVVSRIGSQTDIASTLLKQMNIPAEKYAYSKNLLSVHSGSFAFYTFNHGFGFIQDSAACFYDLDKKNYIRYEGDSNGLVSGKAYLQAVYEDFLKK